MFRLIERKLDDVTNELVEVKKQLQELQDKTIGDTIKKSISDMVDRAENRIADMKATLTEVKDNMKAKATEIVQAVRRKQVALKRDNIHTGCSLRISVGKGRG